MLNDMAACGEVTWKGLLASVGASALDAELKAAAYISAVNRLPLLSQEEEVSLARRLRASGDLEAAEAPPVQVEEAHVVEDRAAPDVRAQLLYRMLADPVLSVRIAAARGLAGVPAERASAEQRAAIVQTDCTYGCPIGSLALELHEPAPPVRARLEANFTVWIDAIERCLGGVARRSSASRRGAACSPPSMPKRKRSTCKPSSVTRPSLEKRLKKSSGSMTDYLIQKK